VPALLHKCPALHLAAARQGAEQGSREQQQAFAPTRLNLRGASARPLRPPALAAPPLCRRHWRAAAAARARVAGWD